MNVGLPSHQEPIGKPTDSTGIPTLDCSDSIPDGTRAKALVRQAIATSCDSFICAAAGRTELEAHRPWSWQPFVKYVSLDFRRRHRLARRDGQGIRHSPNTETAHQAGSDSRFIWIPWRRSFENWVNTLRGWVKSIAARFRQPG